MSSKKNKNLDFKCRSAWAQYYEVREVLVARSFPNISESDDIKGLASNDNNVTRKILLNYQSNNKEYECPVCYDVYPTDAEKVRTSLKSLTMFGCGHFLCGECKKACSKAGYRDCPVCRISTH